MAEGPWIFIEFIFYPLACPCLTKVYRVAAISWLLDPVSISKSWTSVMSYGRERQSRSLGLDYEIRMEGKNKLECTSVSWPVYEDVVKFVWVLIAFDLKHILQRPGPFVSELDLHTWSRGRWGSCRPSYDPTNLPSELLLKPTLPRKVQKMEFGLSWHIINPLQPIITCSMYMLPFYMNWRKRDTRYKAEPFFLRKI